MGTSVGITMQSDGDDTKSGDRGDITMPNGNEKSSGGEYVFYIPDGRWSNHFSSLLLSADIPATMMEVLLVGGVFLVGSMYQVQVTHSMPLLELAYFMLLFSVIRRLYNSYLEAVFCSFPQFRTQPVREHALKTAKDLTGRDLTQLASIVKHDRLTLISQFLLDVSIYFMVPGYYPAQQDSYDSLQSRILRLIINHYVMSFGMYWMHRALHVHPWLWRRIHSLHHWAKHPLSRTTYQDHWADNFGNAIVGHFFAQIIVPLDYQFFLVSRLIRICESLEKHSGVSCWFNIAHSLQKYFPFAQMPHHHDWHHEGHKGCNYTFSSIGGLWDCVFGTRKAGRHPGISETREDKEMTAVESKQERRGVMMDHPYYCLAPVLAMAILAGIKYQIIGI